MSEIGDLLELLHGARYSYSTLRASTRLWRDEALEREARQRREEAARGARSVHVAKWGSQQGSGDPTAGGDWERSSRVWVRSPSWVRWESEFEREGKQAKSVSVIDGERWWTNDPVHGFTSSKRRGFSLQVPDLDLLDPWQLASDFDFEVRGKGTYAGREAIEAHAVARKPQLGYRRPVSIFAPKGEQYEVAVDLERGIVMRAAALIDDVPFEIAEITDIAFDEDLDEEFFRLEPPPEDERWSRGLTWGRFCNFCGKSSEEVEHMVVGQAVEICDQCSQISRHITRSGPSKD